MGKLDAPRRIGRVRAMIRRGRRSDISSPADVASAESDAGQLSARIILAVTADRSLGLMSGFPGHLVSRGWDVHVISSPGPLSDDLRSVPGVTVHTIQMERDPSPLKDLRAVAEWLRTIKTIRPDVISAGTPKAGLLAAIAGWLLRVPDRVYTVRGLRLETASGFAYHLLAICEWFAFSLSTRALSVSPSLRDEVLRLRLTQPGKISVLGYGSSNGVDVRRYFPRSPADPKVRDLRSAIGLQAEIPVIGFVGRLTLDKGLELLGSALKELTERGVRYQLLVVGGADGEASQGGLFGDEARVYATGHVPDTSVFYALMDVLCLPTLREGFPNVVLEAAASGIPTVTTDATGAVDSVVHRETGLVVNKSDATQLADALDELLADPSLRQSFGSRAREWVVAHYERSGVWNRTEEYLGEGLLTRGRNTPQ